MYIKNYIIFILYFLCIINCKLVVTTDLPTSSNQISNKLTITDEEKKQVLTPYIFMNKWGGEGDKDGEFRKPSGVIVDSKGNVYVADTGNYRIQKFDSNGKFIAKWGSKGNKDGQFQFPLKMTLDCNGFIYVTDFETSYIQKFNSNGKFITKWISSMDTNNTRGLLDIAIDSRQTIYTIFSFFVFAKYNTDGMLMDMWDMRYKKCHNLESTAIDPLGNIYLVTYEIYDYPVFTENQPYFHAGAYIKKFDKCFNLINEWGTEGKKNEGFTGWLINNGFIPAIAELAIDSMNNIYVVECAHSQIQKYDSEGNFLCKWGSEGTGDGEFILPRDIAIDQEGNVYVADYGNNCIQKFAPNPEFKEDN